MFVRVLMGLVVTLGVALGGAVLVGEAEGASLSHSVGHGVPVIPTPSPASGSRSRLDFRQLDEAAARADACEAKTRDAYDHGDNKKTLLALNEQAKCLEVILFGISREFYDKDAFGAGGLQARIAELRSTLGNLYATIYSEPKTCAPNCGEIYQIWAAEAYVTSIRIMLDDMIERLKDESPIHQP